MGLAWPFAVGLGVVTAFAFAFARGVGPSVRGPVHELPNILLVGVFIVVAVFGFGAPFRGQTLGSVLLVAMGPVGGFLAYLAGYRLFFPPSTDSPTWLLFLVFALGSVGVGLVVFLAGRAIERWTKS